MTMLITHALDTSELLAALLVLAALGQLRAIIVLQRDTRGMSHPEKSDASGQPEERE